MSNSHPISLVIADDHPAVRSGLRTVFAGSNFEIVGEATTGEDALSLTRKHKPDVLLLDVRLPDMDCFDVLSKIQTRAMGTRVVVLSAFDNPTYVARAMTHGAWDYVLKSTRASQIRKAVERAYLREPPDNTSAATQILQSMNVRQPHLATGLTAREAQVLRHLGFGLSNREIGRSLDISVETVKEHVQNILRKTKKVDRTQAAVWAVKNGLV